ncbi:MAG: hypothetical protein HC851_15425 [Acaryochloris sp. RU_4_1]|nr:hypothetical protein [Acaryochloris sp. RU_4_1]
MDNPALAHYLLHGLHRARGLRQINWNHDNYWRTQSMVRYLKRGISVDKALRWSGLSEKRSMTCSDMEALVAESLAVTENLQGRGHPTYPPFAG